MMTEILAVIESGTVVPWRLLKPFFFPVFLTSEE